MFFFFALLGWLILIGLDNFLETSQLRMSMSFFFVIGMKLRVCDTGFEKVAGILITIITHLSLSLFFYYTSSYAWASSFPKRLRLISHGFPFLIFTCALSLSLSKWVRLINIARGSDSISIYTHDQKESRRWKKKYMYTHGLPSRIIIAAEKKIGMLIDSFIFYEIWMRI